jgi:HPt (histidine-containing phosphotransfer) domain-containing protein
MTTPTIDPATFEELKATTGAEFALELVGTFLEEAPGMLNDLRTALGANDADTFRRAAHSLKSNGNTFGALNFAAQARALELGGLAGVKANGSKALDELDAEFARVAAALAALRYA